jgi:hypothetical protein
MRLVMGTRHTGQARSVAPHSPHVEWPQLNTVSFRLVMHMGQVAASRVASSSARSRADSAAAADALAAAAAPPDPVAAVGTRRLGTPLLLATAGAGALPGKGALAMDADVAAEPAGDPTAAEAGVPHATHAATPTWLCMVQDGHAQKPGPGALVGAKGAGFAPGAP